MKSFLAKKGEIEQKWLLVDATDKILGRLAVKIATILMGKNKPTYTQYVDVGDYVIVVNAEKVRVSGNKAESKQYDYYTKYPDGRKVLSYKEMMQKNPEKILELAVQRMMPKNKLARNMMKKLKIYRGPEHEHQSQKPVKIEI